MKQALDVLIVEDDVEWQSILGEVVVLAGHNPVVAGTERQAMELVERSLYPLAFIDLALTLDNADHGGLRVLRRIRQWRDNTRAIVLTAHGDIEIGANVKDEYDVVDAWAKGSFSRERAASTVTREAGYWFPPRGEFLETASVLRAQIDVLIWESKLRGLTTNRSGDAGKLRQFVIDAFAPVWPLLPLRDAVPLVGSEGASAASGVFWSRRHGRPVLAVLGEADAVQEVIDGGLVPDGVLNGRTWNRVYTQRGPSLLAAVIELADEDRATRQLFATTK